jgi:hypothetical protein
MMKEGSTRTRHWIYEVEHTHTHIARLYVCIINISKISLQ